MHHLDLAGYFGLCGGEQECTDISDDYGACLPAFWTNVGFLGSL